MIIFLHNNNAEPFIRLRKKYEEASLKNQKSIDAISISSFDKSKQEVNSRYVNLKFIDDDKFIFFSNYDSPKSNEFQSHNRIAALIYWDSINVQIRIKAKIKKTSYEYNQNYFFNRAEEKNALAISSNQSKPIDSFSHVVENYNKSLKNNDLKKCPKYWGGYSFKPFEIEFWEGNEFRLNKRNLYKKHNNDWNNSILEP
jgi:pyridoxamine 5'-phosphate oxidase